MKHTLKPNRPKTIEEALPNRSTVIEPPPRHHVTGRPIPTNDTPLNGLQRAIVGMGCFWGAERLFWRLDGVYSTAVGYAGGLTENPSYEDVCSGLTGHAEVVQIVYDPAELSYESLLKAFWENHDPTQGDRQGADVGSQYRSLILTYDASQMTAALASKAQFSTALSSLGKGSVTTDIEPVSRFFFAEPLHQQYLSRNPNGYCGLKGTGALCSIA